MKEKIGITLSTDVVKGIKLMAQADHRTVSAMINLILLRAIEDAEKTKAARV